MREFGIFYESICGTDACILQSFCENAKEKERLETEGKRREEQEQREERSLSAVVRLRGPDMIRS
jgi:hypothetical protein